MNFVASRRSALAALALAGLFASGFAQAAPVSFAVPLSGGEQVPPITSSGTGSAELTFDPATRVVTWSIAYSGLSGPATMAHFHGPAAAGANGPVTLWLSAKGESPVSPTGRNTTSACPISSFSWARSG